MDRQLALTLRPRAFSELIGQELATTTIRNESAKRNPTAWMFVGPTGSGKTTIARILALSLQCGHGRLGEPCENCQKQASKFCTIEVNASDMTGVDDVRSLAEGSTFVPSPPSKYRIFILDECQRMSAPAQNCLLKYFEDAPSSTVWMICTTEQNKILGTLRRRCFTIEMKGLGVDDIKKLAIRAYDFANKPYKENQKVIDKMVEAILRARIQSPALILNAIEKHLAGMPTKEAVRNLSLEGNELEVCIAMATGDWNTVRKQIKDMNADDLTGVRASTAGFLREKLLDAFPGPPAKQLSTALSRLAQVDRLTDATKASATVGVMYDLCELFKGAVGTETEDLSSEKNF